MKKLLIDASAFGKAFLIDIDTPSVKVVKQDRSAVDKVYLITEPTNVIIQAPDGTTEERKAEDGDIIVTFYDSYFPNKVIIIKSDEWKENIEVSNTHLQNAKITESECVGEPAEADDVNKEITEL